MRRLRPTAIGGELNGGGNHGKDLHFETFTRISELIRSRQISSVEVTRALLDRIAQLDGKYRSYATVLADRAMSRAATADVETAKDIWRGPLHGVPIAVKDLCFTEFGRTTGGTMIRKNWTPDHNATVIDRLEQGGAVILGKLKMTEGAYTSHHPDDPSPLNPWNLDHWVGSSSTGSGVATAAGLCYGSLGSDTGGSIRFPSATCGLTGIKPTWGRVSRYGVFALAASLDHVGPMTRSAADAGAILGVIAGADPNDPTALQAARAGLPRRRAPGHPRRNRRRRSVLQWRRHRSRGRRGGRRGRTRAAEPWRQDARNQVSPDRQAAPRLDPVLFGRDRHRAQGDLSGHAPQNMARRSPN